jgi:hypothetical protein
LSGVVFGEGSPPVLVVDVEELGRVAAERSSAASKR